MIKTFVSLAALVILAGIGAEASVYKGQKEYMKSCKSCHGKGDKISTSYTIDEWNQFFANKGQKIIGLHKDDEKANEYFSGDRFRRKSNDLLDFMIEYAKDSGNVPACN